MVKSAPSNFKFIIEESSASSGLIIPTNALNKVVFPAPLAPHIAVSPHENLSLLDQFLSSLKT